MRTKINGTSFKHVVSNRSLSSQIPPSSQGPIISLHGIELHAMTVISLVVGCFMIFASQDVALAQSSSRGVPVPQERPVYQNTPRVITQGRATTDLLPEVSEGSSRRGPSATMSTSSPKLGLEGYCPVCIIEMNKWVRGDKRFKTIYDGKTYYFPSDKQLRMFLADPAKYTPVAGGDCVVCLANMKKRVSGNIRHAAIMQKQLYLFPNEQLKKEFVSNPQKYYRAADALEGYCPVCRVEMNQLVKGKEEFSAYKDGLRYLFPSEKQQRMFFSNPKKYSAAK